MNVVYVTKNRNYVVTTVALDGSYDIRRLKPGPAIDSTHWPFIANRDMSSEAIKYADRLESTAVEVTS